MKYFVPAWQNKFDDWAYAIHKIEFDDAISNLRIQLRNGEPCGVIVADYIPQLAAQLDSEGVFPQTIWSAFDLIQGVESPMTRRIVDLDDFTWPAGTWFEYDPFRIVPYLDEQKIAQIIFNARGQILRIERFKDEWHFQDLVMDSRGWISCLKDYDQDSQLAEVTFLDPDGTWRIKENAKDGQITVNPLFETDFEQLKYPNRQALIDECLAKIVDQHLDPAVDQIIMTAADQQQIDPALFDDFAVAMTISRWHDFNAFLSRSLPWSKYRLITDSPRVDEQVHQMLGDELETLMLPIFASQFHLGHSRELLEQKIVLVVNDDDQTWLLPTLKQIVERIDPARDHETLQLISYDDQKLNHAKEILRELIEADHPMILLDPSEDELKANQDLQNANLAPELADLEADNQPIPVYTRRIGMPGDVLPILDEARILVDLDPAPDDFLQMAAISIGIPQINRVQTDLVEDHQNGLVIQTPADLDAALEYYLQNMKHWNQALVSAVAKINQYSDEMIIAAWQNLWGKEANNND